MGKYSERTVAQLYGSASHCAHPDCNEPLTQQDRGHVTPAAQIAHIRSEKRTGPRHVPGYPNVNGFENLLLLCYAHHKTVDDNESTYSIEELEEWKDAQIAQAGHKLSAGELRQIIERLPTTRSIEASIGSSVRGQVHAMEPGREVLDSWLGTYREELLASVANADPRPVHEARTPEEYRAEVDNHIERCRAAFLTTATDLGRALPPLVFRVENLTETNLTAVELTVSFPANVWVNVWNNESPESLELPDPPRVYGAPDVTAGVYGMLWPSPVPYNFDDIRLPDPRAVEIEASDAGTTVSFAPVDLRPRKSFGLEEITAVVFDLSCRTVSVAWEATCTNHDGIAAGRIELEAVEHCEGSLCELVFHLESADN